MKIIKTKSFEIAVNEYGDPNSERVCLMLPGRLDTKDYINFTKHGGLMAELGIYAVVLDPPGTWDSPGDIEDYSTTMYIQAVNELIEALGSRPTILLGHSRGGATAMLASSNPAVTAIVLINAAYGSPSSPNPNKVVDGRLRESRDLPPGSTRTEEQRIFMLPLGYFEDGRKYNPVASLKKFSGKKLIVHANKDEFSKIEKVQAVYDQLSNPRTFLEIDCTHDYRLFPAVINEINLCLKDFLRGSS